MLQVEMAITTNYLMEKNGREKDRNTVCEHVVFKAW